MMNAMIPKCDLRLFRVRAKRPRACASYDHGGPETTPAVPLLFSTDLPAAGIEMFDVLARFTRLTHNPIRVLLDDEVLNFGCVVQR
jgi:hypothetical protein